VYTFRKNLESAGISVIATEAQTNFLHVTEKYVTSRDLFLDSVAITGISPEFKNISVPVPG